MRYEIERLTKDGWHCFASCGDLVTANLSFQSFRKDMPRTALRIVESDGRRLVCLHDPRPTLS
ncbi:MAG: hypothetical protein ACOY4R_27450 [Pseudomonadota bacterium]